MANIFTKGLDKNDQKEGLFKRLENIKDKNKELRTHLVQPIKLVRMLKMRVILAMIQGMLFTGFTETLKNLREWYQEILNTASYQHIN